MLVKDPAWQARIWRSAGWPDVLLVDGAVTEIWRARKVGERLRVGVDLIDAVRPESRDQIEQEAVSLAPSRGCVTTELSLR